MAGEISGLTALTAPAGGDLLEIVDVSDPTLAPAGTNKKIRQDQLFKGTGLTTVAIGPSATAAGNLGVAVGNSAAATGPAGVAIGASANAGDDYGVALGAYSAATGTYSSMALGDSSTASGNYAVTVGSTSTASHAYSVAVGALSQTEADNTVSVGKPALLRKITSVADGTAANHAVNLSQLQAVDITGPTTPASAAAAGTQGTVYWDADYIYVCIAANTWKRVAIATW